LALVRGERSTLLAMVRRERGTLLTLARRVQAVRGRGRGGAGHVGNIGLIAGFRIDDEGQGLDRGLEGGQGRDLDIGGDLDLGSKLDAGLGKGLVLLVCSLDRGRHLVDRGLVSGLGQDMGDRLDGNVRSQVDVLLGERA